MLCATVTATVSALATKPGGQHQEDQSLLLHLQDQALINAKQSVEEAEQTLIKTENRLASAHADLTAAQQQLKDVQASVDTAKATASALKEQQHQLQQQVHALHAEAEAAQHEHARIQTGIAAAQVELEEEQVQVNRLRQEGWEMQETLTATKSKAAEMGQDTAPVKKEDAANSIAAGKSASSGAAGVALRVAANSDGDSAVHWSSRSAQVNCC